LKNSLGKRIPNFWGEQTLTEGALAIAFFTILSALLGLVRDRFLTATFLITKAGELNQSLDVYYAAFLIPDTIYYLVFLGSLAAAFIPVFSGYLKEKREKEAFYVANTFLSFTLFLTIVLVLLIFLFAPILIKLVAPGFEPEKRRLTVSLLRLMLLSPAFFGISNTAGAILNSFKRFTLYAIAPCFYNLGIIVATLLFHHRLAIYAPTIGVLIGAFLHMIIQLWGAYSLGFRWRFIFDFKHPAVLRIFKLMLPRMATLAVDRINRWIITAFASTLAMGSVSILNLANNLQSLPVSFLGVSVAIAAFPFLTEAVSSKNENHFVHNLQNSLRYLLYLFVPISVLMFLLRVQIVRIILGTGHFGWVDTRLTAACLGMFVISLFAQGTAPLLSRAFYALSDTFTPFKLALCTIIINALGAIFLTKQSFIQSLSHLFKVQNGFDARIIGLALTFTLSSIAYMILLLWKVSKKVPLHLDLLSWNILKILAAAGIMGLSIQTAKWIFGSILDLTHGSNLLLQTVSTAMVGCFVYLVISHYLKIEEAKQIINKLKSIYK